MFDIKDSKTYSLILKIRVVIELYSLKSILKMKHPPDHKD